MLLCCALLLRLAIPAGWMPVIDARGVHLAICPGMAPMPMPMSRAISEPVAHGAAQPAMSGHHRPADEHRAEEHPCAFAGLALALAEPVAPGVALAPVPARASAVVPAATGAAIGRGLAAPPPPATGPPILV